MVSINDVFCIDIYESSRTDATETSQGLAADINNPPIANVIPIRIHYLHEAQSTCASVGKRLCTPEEWKAACSGPDDHFYTYGDTYTVGNCSDYDSGYGDDPTGSFPNCTNAYGVYDMNGNMWELDSEGNPRGGAHNCNPSWRELHSCPCEYWDEASSSWKDSCVVSCTSAYCGVRCCQDF